VKSTLARRHARDALLVTGILYLGYIGLRQIVPALADYTGLFLLVGFYFLPGWMLRDHPALAAADQVGPDGPIPPWQTKGARWALLLCLLVFPPFVLGFLWFYAEVCQGQTWMIQPVYWLEDFSPWSGRLSRFLDRLCQEHNGEFFPPNWVLPNAWQEYWGLGFFYQLANGIFAVALPEEVFHRGYLLGVFERAWPARFRVFGVPMGWAAILSSAIFAVGHLASVGETSRLATFFPSIVFVWIWRKSGSLWAPTLFHVASNLLMDFLLTSTFQAR